MLIFRLVPTKQSETVKAQSLQSLLDISSRIVRISHLLRSQALSPVYLQWSCPVKFKHVCSTHMSQSENKTRQHQDNAIQHSHLTPRQLDVLPTSPCTHGSKGGGKRITYFRYMDLTITTTHNKPLPPFHIKQHSLFMYNRPTTAFFPLYLPEAHPRPTPSSHSTNITHTHIHIYRNCSEDVYNPIINH